jgi:membrane protease YdiL (CAAX protease family)
VKKTLLFYAGMLLVAALGAAVLERWWPESGVSSLFTPPHSLDVGAASVATAVLVALLVVHLGRALESVKSYREMAVWLKRLLQELLGAKPLDALDAGLLASASAIGEEALFRGFLQPWLGWLVATRLLGRPDATPVAGIVLASLLFGGLHAPVVRELRPWTAFAIVLGLVFGCLFEWSGSLLAPVVAHFTINFLNLRRIAALPDPGPVPSDAGRATAP